MANASPQLFKPPRDWPRPADPAAALRLAAQFAALGRRQARLVHRPEGAAMLAAIGGGSPYLAELALRESASLLRFAEHGPDSVLAAALGAIAAADPAAPRARIASLLRAAKRQAALVIALADIGGVWPLERVTASLSDLAEASLGLAVGHLLRAAHEAGALRLATPDRPAADSGFTVLGLGKLGGRELNYSSDVDLILLYDPSAHPEAGDDLGALFTRLARSLVDIMEARDGEGYVFRVDLRLRPDPAATPPAVSLPAAIAYYESMGQNWERAALLKARPVAGDLALGAAFLTAIRPFIWRRHLDFAAIADIHAMKRRIDAHKGVARGGRDRLARIAGFDLKLGPGGIREIEFLAQTLQLVWGGRDPALRGPATLGALQLLARAGHLPRRAAREMAVAYRFLRTAEHRLQMVADRQTHRLPERAAALAHFAWFLGFADAEAFAVTLSARLAQVRACYAELFETVPDAPGGTAELDFSGPDADPRTLAALAAMGFANPLAIVAAVKSWQAGRPRALRSQLARELLSEMLPRLLAALSRQAEPDAAFTRFAALLDRLPTGVQPLSLFQRYPVLLDRVAAVLGAAPPLAEHLARVPAALEGLLAPQDPVPPARLMRARLTDAAALEDAIAAIRLVVRAEDFRISVAAMEGRLDVDRAGLARTGLAEAALNALLPLVLAEQNRRYGRVRGGVMAVVALGKAGGREMLAGSDLDLMLIYDHPERVAESTVPPGGTARSLPASQWFIRAAHAFIAALTAPGPEGPLYAVDMRLRPSGNKGPVAVSLAAFRRYHAQSAWTWERMALTRALVVAGPPAFRAEVAAAITAALAFPPPAAVIRADAAAMRFRLARDLPPAGGWDVKHRVGGLMEVEFIAQALQLVHLPAHPAVVSQTTRSAFARLAAAGLLTQADAALLIRADRVWRGVQQALRLTLGQTVIAQHKAALPQEAVAVICRAAEITDPAGLEAELDRLSAAVRDAFLRLIGAPGEPAPETTIAGGGTSKA